MSDQANGIEALLESVSEGRRVDWEAAERGPADTASRIRALRQVARIADFSRDAQRAGSYSIAGGFRTSTEPRRWGSLMLLELLGAGTTGEVWRAWDPQLQREVALKLLQVDGGPALPADLSPLLEEGRALARVQHPNVVTVHGIETHGGRVGLRLEFVRGTSLEHEILRRGALPPAEVARLGANLARALAAVHAAGLVHRDVKPANVVIEPQGRLVLTDFGLGQRRFTAGDDATRITGTPMFMSPERLEGAPATERDDVYGAGITLWCALAGRHPFEARTLGALKSAVHGGPSRPLSALRPELPAALVQVVERAMAPEAAGRFASANELADALEAAIAPPRVVRRGARAAWLAAAAVPVIAGAAALWSITRPRPELPPATSAPPAVVAPAAVAYDVSASLVRHDADGTQRLANGDRVRPGDRLSLEFHASRPAYVYVLNEDERGESYLLFPQPLFDQANPVPAGATVTLPGTVGGAANAWTVTSRGGREHFLVVASPEPVAELEAELSRLPAARPDHVVQYAAVPPAAMERLRGVGGVAQVPQADGAPRRAGNFEHFRTLAETETGVHGTWVRQITLENPLR